ncbi:MAG: SH3 domain-containing protein [Lachnospiraceae bacterium]|nr:SH3 domain-containing protein [Lachnospiraceae bacterium]
MKKKYIAILMAAIMAASFAGCGKKKEETPPPATATPAPTATTAPTPTIVPMPIYSFDGTNAEKAIVDYLANNYTRQKAGSVVIPHMDILKMDDKEATLDIYGVFRVCEYTLNDSQMHLESTYEADSRFTLDKNVNDTFTVKECIEVKNFTDETELQNLVAGDNDLLETFKDQNRHDVEIQPWPSIRGNDFAFYGYDNNLTIKSGSDGTDSKMTVPKVLFSVDKPKEMYTNADIHVRTAPDEAGHSYYTLLSGAKVTVTGMTETWARVTVENRTGYVAATALTDTAPTMTPTPTVTPSPSPTPSPAATATPTPTPTPAPRPVSSMTGMVTEIQSDHIVIENDQGLIQFALNGNTEIASTDIPVDAVVTIRFYSDDPAAAISVSVDRMPEEYVVVDIDDDDDSSVNNDKQNDEDSYELDTEDDDYVEVELND